MKVRVDHEMRYFSKGSLCLAEDVPGARQWAVSLDQTMLTYFEVDPDCRFESHSHESEQITMVLEGVLYFEQEGKVFGVKAGEVIAIPAMRFMLCLPGRTPSRLSMPGRRSSPNR